ncbi:hypothetical protein SISSUDRAFT_76635 [Sistotremastrum suecicum HHB10207 ss-3]|uniref:Uncharacterized protein n=1 Tax=Sistotremastrum suecicum HHB10207 ss-3 TaxID=1314776 RepID=A0A166BEI9_9AGAM|nr:hypothetical protein SISSUDRAFT_76635 [Sistotremastrum suecicum HHB10207 ss-3]
MAGASTTKLAERQLPKSRTTAIPPKHSPSASTSTCQPQRGIIIDLDMFRELSQECVQTGSAKIFSTALRLLTKIATIPEYDTPERVDVLRGAATAVRKSIVEDTSWPHAALTATHDFIIKSVIKLISKVSDRNDGSLVEEIVSLLVCLAKQLGKSKEALGILDQLSTRILSLPDDARFTIFPQFVKALTSLWLQHPSDFNQVSSITTILSKVLCNCSSAKQSDCFEQSISPILVHIRTSKNLLLANSLFLRLFLFLRERLEQGTHMHAFHLQLISALENLRSAGLDFAVEPLAPVWASSIKSGIAVLHDSFPSLPEGSISMEGIKQCVRCNEVSIEQHRVIDGLSRSHISEVNAWLSKVDKLRPWYSIIEDSDTRERLLEIDNRKSRLYHRLSVFREPAIHYHELIPVSPSSCSQDPLDLEPAPPPTPSYSTNGSAPIDRTASRLMNDRQRGLGAGNLSSVIEVDAEMEESAASMSSTREPYRAAPLASGSAVQSSSRSAQARHVHSVLSSESTTNSKTSLPSSSKQAPAATREVKATAGKVPPPPPPSTIPLKRTHIPAPLDLDSNNRGKRARSEAPISPPPRPEGIAGGSKTSSTSVGAGAAGQTRGPRSTQASIRPPGSSNATASSSRIATRPSLPRRSSSLPPAPPSKAPLPPTKFIPTEPSVVESPNPEMSVAEDFATGSAPQAEADNIAADDDQLQQEVQVVEGQDVGSEGSSAQGSNELIGEGSRIGGVVGSSFDFTFTRTSTRPYNPPGVETPQGSSSSAPRNRVASTSTSTSTAVEDQRSPVTLAELENIFSPRNQAVKPALAVKEPRRSIRLVGLPPGPQV